MKNIGNPKFPTLPSMTLTPIPQRLLHWNESRGMKLIQMRVGFETSFTEGRGGEKGGSANYKTKHTKPLI